MNKFLIARSYLTSVEDCFELKTDFNPTRLREYCYANRYRFMTYHKDSEYDQRREALPLTNLDGTHTDASFISIRGTGLTEMSFTEKTEHYHKSGVGELLDRFGEDLGRTHIINTRRGGFFKPHRDGPIMSQPEKETFRLVYCIDHCNTYEMHFTLENEKVLPLRTGGLYYINTMKTHTQVSFHEDCFFVIANIQISDKSLHILDELSARP